MIDPQSYSASASSRAEQRTAGYMPVVGEKNPASSSSFDALVDGAQQAAARNEAAKSAGTSKHHGFLDFLVTVFDILNPLEHIPIVSTIYEHITGHHMNPVARIAGDTLYGGPIGTAVGIANVVSEKKTGKDLGENMMAMLSGHKDKGAQPAMVAQASVKASDIAWDTPAAQNSVALAQSTPSTHTPSIQQNFTSLAATRSHGASEGKAPAGDDPISLPVIAKGGPSAVRGLPGGTKTSLAADSTPGLSTQEAPADESSRVIPPELIAKKMMDGLDKYAAMKKAQTAASYSAVF